MVTAVISESIDLETLTSETFILKEAGADKYFDTQDDQTLNGSLSFDETTNRINWDYSTDLPIGNYRVSVLPPLSDLAGNELLEPYFSSFKLLGYMDSDGDGLPDFWEIEQGLDPFNPDSDGDGIPDGKEDEDNDRLPNIGEFLLDTDPGKEDSNGDGTKDGDYDDDLDGLLNGREFLVGTDPLQLDTDGDGLSDLDEINEGTNPLSPNTLPPVSLGSAITSFLNAVPFTPQSQSIIIISPEASYQALEP